MKNRLLCLALLMLAALAPCGLAGTLVGKPSQLTSPDQVPEGLAKSDWQSIRDAYDAGRHAFQPVGDGWQARNPGQQWLTQFDGQGFTVTPDAGGWTWGLELAGYGKPTKEWQEGKKISYARADGLTEWFINDTRGLEQGWTLTQRPERAGPSGPVRLDLTVRGGLRPQVSPEGASVAFLNESGGAALTYGGLKAWDADGKTVQARFVEGEGRSDSLGVVVDDEEAKYPITVDPIAQQVYLKASNTGISDYFGVSVAVSGDTVVVGAYLEDSNATGVNGNQVNNSSGDSGAVYVFVRSGTTWSQQAYLKASNTGDGDAFGYSVAVSGDTVVVGAHGEDSTATGVNGNQTNDSAQTSGAAYVFVRSGTTWSQQAYLKASNAGGIDYFGYSVAVSGDTVVVGAYLEDSNATGVNGNQADNSVRQSGAAYVFVRSGTTWSQQAYLKASKVGGGDSFGQSVAVSGETIVVGAEGDRSNATGEIDYTMSNVGAGYVFVRSGTTWSQQLYLKDSNAGDQDLFGTSVAVSGNTMVVGARQESSRATGVNGTQTDNLAAQSGAAFVFSIVAYSLFTPAVDGSVTGAGDYPIGSTATVTATAAPGYVFTGWTGNASGTANPLSVLMNADKTIGATFTRQFTLTITPPTNGTITGIASGGKYLTGTSATLTANPDPGYVFTGWTGDASGTTNPLSVVMNSDKSIGATFTWQYALSTTPPTNGSISGLASDGKYPDGTTATLTANPDPGYVFTGWTGDATGMANPLSVLMNADKTIGATFTRQYTLTTTTTLTNGTITGIASGGKYLTGTTATLTAAPFPNYVFAGWTGDASGAANPLSVQMDSDKMIGATFEPDSVDSDGDGLTAYLERVIYGTNPNLADTDGDGLTDAWEVGLGRFSIIQGTFTWEQARTDAKAKAGNLASFPDENRWNRAMDTLGANALDPYTGLWIGAGDAAEEGKWTWVNGEAFVYQRWATNRPSTGTGNTVDYVEIAGGAGGEMGKWYDRTSLISREGYLLETGYASSPTDADSDDDGLGDAVEVKATATNPLVKDTDGDGVQDADEDLDGDGFTNREELELFLTAPNNASDRFSIEFEYSPSAHALRFPTVSGRSYRVERSLKLSDPTGWSEAVTFTGSGATVTVPLGAPFSSTWFYRVRVSLN